MNRVVISSGAVLLASAISASASTQTFNDEALWRAAVGGVYGFENFDAIATGTELAALPGLGLSLDPLNDGTQPTVQPYSSTGGVARSGPNNILNDADFSLPGRGPITVRPDAASDFIFGFGLWNVGRDDTLKLTFFDDMGDEIASVVSAVSSGFFGIVDDTGAKSATIDFVGGNGYAPTDDWQAATRETFVPGAVVPLPASLPLLLAGMAGFYGVSRRRRKS